MPRGVPPMSMEEAQHHLNEVAGCALLDNALKLKRTFKFDNFDDAMQFAQHASQLCEAEGHHPDLGIGLGCCRVEFQTHKINGLHENEFIMAAEVNRRLNRALKT